MSQYVYTLIFSLPCLYVSKSSTMFSFSTEAVGVVLTLLIMCDMMEFLCDTPAALQYDLLQFSASGFDQIML